MSVCVVQWTVCLLSSCTEHIHIVDTNLIVSCCSFVSQKKDRVLAPI